MTMRRISHFLLLHKRMNRYLLDVGLCKRKKLWEEIIQFFAAYEGPNLKILGLNSRVKWEKLTSVCDREPLIECIFRQFQAIQREKNDLSLLQTRKLQSPHHPPHRKYLYPKKSTGITPTGRICLIVSFADCLNLPYV